MNPFHSGQRMPIAPTMIVLATVLAAMPAKADPTCLPITAPVLEIAAVDCTTVWPQLQASRRFPDVFAGAGKMTQVCYASTGPAAASLGNTPVTIASSLSGWTTDF